MPALKPYALEANVPGNAGGWGLRDGSMSFCRKGNWWDEVVFWSTPLNKNSVGGGDWPDARRGSVCLTSKNAASEKQRCPLGNVLVLLPPFLPCPESRHTGDKPCCHHLYWVKWGPWDFLVAKLKLRVSHPGGEHLSVCGTDPRPLGSNLAIANSLAHLINLLHG